MAGLTCKNQCPLLDFDFSDSLQLPELGDGEFKFSNLYLEQLNRSLMTRG